MDTDATAWEYAGRHGSDRPIGALLDGRDPRAWVALDLWVRSESRFTDRRDRGEAPPSEWALAFDLCHADGRIREAALLSVARFPALLPLIAIRCSDWATPVRDQALALLRVALPGLSPQVTASVTGVALRVADRLHGARLLDLVDANLRQTPVDVIEAVLAGPDRASRRLGHRIALERGLFAPLRLARTAAKDSDVVVQDRCASAALAALPGPQEDKILALLLKSRQPRVRSAGVTALNRLGRPAAAAPYLADRSAIVRACARWVLRQQGADPLPAYRAMCADAPEKHPAAPTGLGECGTREDAALLRKLIAHPHPAVRAHAVAGLRVLGAVDLDDVAALLDDPAAAVVREATQALLPSADRLSEEWLQERLAAGRPRPTRVAASRLLRARGRDTTWRATGPTW